VLFSSDRSPFLCFDNKTEGDEKKSTEGVVRKNGLALAVGLSPVTETAKELAGEEGPDQDREGDESPAKPGKDP